MFWHIAPCTETLYTFHLECYTICGNRCGQCYCYCEFFANIFVYIPRVPSIRSSQIFWKTQLLPTMTISRKRLPLECVKKRVFYLTVALVMPHLYHSELL